MYSNSTASLLSYRYFLFNVFFEKHILNNRVVFIPHRPVAARGDQAEMYLPLIVNLSQ